MAQLLVRGVSEDTILRLKERAALHGRSVEAEHRVILEAAVTKPMTTEEWARSLQGTFLADLDPEELRDSQDTGREFDWP